MTPTITVSRDLGADAGALVAMGMATAIARSGRARIAVPGGRSPVPVLHWLAANLSADVARHGVVTLVDERHLPGNDVAHWPDLPSGSNLRSLWAHWLSRTDARPVVVALDSPGPLDVAVRVANREFRAHVGRLDVALLGIGEDGHIGSLFPGRPELHLPGPVLGVRDSPKPPPERITLAMPVLAGADLVVVVASGAAKGAALARTDDALPLTHLDPRGAYHWVVDPDAAAHLE